MELSKHLAPLARRVSNLLARGAVTLTNAAGMLQTLQVSLLASEAKDGMEHLEPYGFTSNPHVGAEILAAFIEGDRSHGVVLVAADRRYRLRGLQPGETALYGDHGDFVKLGLSGIVINGGGLPITINNAGSVTVVSGDVLADGISLKHHTHATNGAQPS